MDGVALSSCEMRRGGGAAEGSQALLLIEMCE